MSPGYKALISILFVGCGSPSATTITKSKVAFTIKGTVQLLNPGPEGTATVDDSQLGSTVLLVIFKSNTIGWCLGSDYLSVNPNAVNGATVATLKSGAAYSQTVLDNNFTYPLTVYPFAQTTNTLKPQHSICEQDANGGLDRYNANGGFGIDGIDDPCCYLTLKGVQVDHPGQILEGIDIDLLVGKPADACPAVSDVPSACTKKGNACWNALGADADKYINQGLDASGKPIPCP